MAPEETKQASPEPSGRLIGGVDLTLMRRMISLSPLERLEVLQASAGSSESLRQELRGMRGR